MSTSLTLSISLSLNPFLQRIVNRISFCILFRHRLDLNLFLLVGFARRRVLPVRLSLGSLGLVAVFAGVSRITRVNLSLLLGI